MAPTLRHRGAVAFAAGLLFLLAAACPKAQTPPDPAPPSEPVNAPSSPDADRLKTRAAASLAAAATRPADAPPMGLSQPSDAPSPQPRPAADPARLFLLVRDGSQCTLQEGSAGVAAAERSRLESRGLAVKQVHVAFMLRADVMPAACIPADEVAFFEKYPFARAGLQKAGGIVCEACGCPEPWYFCVEAAATDAAMRTAGYAPVR